MKYHIEYHNVSGEDGGRYGEKKFDSAEQAQKWLDDELLHANAEMIADLACDNFSLNDEDGSFICDLEGVQ